jgi:acetyl esterase/lipase
MGERSGRAFDVVVVGGGSAGCMLAARISEDFACTLPAGTVQTPPWSPASLQAPVPDSNRDGSSRG